MLKFLRNNVLVTVTAMAMFGALSLSLPGLAGAAEITVSAAASLTNAFTEVKAEFEKKNPDIKVQTNFAASNPLLKQIESGAPVDVFASADQATMDRADSLKLMDSATRVNFAANSLVLIVPAGESTGLTKASELTDKSYRRVAIGNPDSVPAGRYAKEALTAQKLWEPLKDKYIMSESVRQVLDYVVRAEVDAGFVYATDARQGGDKVRLVGVMDGASPVLYPIAVVDSSKNKKEAQVFIDFVKSAEGQAILAKYGFSKS